MKQKILCVDNDPLVLQGYRILLGQKFVDVDYFENPKKAFEKVKENPQSYFMALVDYQMPNMDGGTFIEKVKAINPDFFCILISSFATNEELSKIAQKANADRFLNKSDTESLQMIIDDILESRSIESASFNSALEKNKKIIKEILGLVGCSQPLAQAAKKVKQFSKSNKETVLITGESGVGKEQIARSVHNHSKRATAPFIPVNCGAIPETLIESILFGSKKGSHDKAYRDEIGKIEAANGGTLFLDEVGEMSLDMQVKILRFLENEEIDPVGAKRPKEVNVRVVAATNRHLRNEVRKGRFREDLYYRLNILSIDIAPLRERPEDIEPLIQHFLKIQEKENGECKGITEKAIRKLKGRFWPGNVRELKSMIKRAFHFSERPIINHKIIEDVSEIDDISEMKDHIFKKSKGFMTYEEFETLFLECESVVLNKALRKAKGVKKDAAKILGIGHTRMNYRLEKIKSS